MIAMDGDSLPEGRFFEILEEYRLRARGDFERYVLRGESLVPDPDLLGPDYKLEQLEIPSFDPGFDLVETIRSKLLTGVDPAGPAFSAGLREGARLVHLENASRFSSSWNEREPLIVTAAQGNEQRKYELMPLGRPLRVYQFVPKE